MVFHALSERAKKIAKRRTVNSEYQKAVDAYHQEQAKPEGMKKLGLRKIAAKFGVHFVTLGRLAKGMTSASSFFASKQKLTPVEERTLVDLVKESSDRGFPPEHGDMEMYANAILLAKHGNGYEPVGKQWIFRFIDRHREELQTHWSRPLDTQRARALNPEAVKDWFDMVQKWIVDLGIRPEDIYGMDESGFPPANQGRTRVIGRRGTKTQHKQGGANRENVTAIVTICADGTALDPMIIFKGQNLQAGWGQDNVSHASISCSSNGWTDGDLACRWIEVVFDAQTKAKAGGRTRVLLMDGHSSHYTHKLLLYARANNIIILGYPPHCTHALQGLDVVCFACMKDAFKKEIEAHERLHKRPVSKADFAGVFGRAYLRAFTVDTIKAAFRATGVHPFDRTVIKPSQTKPSLPTSTKGSFPLPQPSPVRAVMASFHHYAPTAAEVEDDTHTTFPDTTPTRKRARVVDPVVDPDLYTPSKRMRLLTGALASTSTGSYLVSKAKMTSSAPIHDPVLEMPPPLPAIDWSLAAAPPVASSSRVTIDQMEAEQRDLRAQLALAKQHIAARDLVIEASHAQLVVQNLVLRKQNDALHSKENTKAVDKTRLFVEGKGQVLTADEFVQKIQDIADRRQAKQDIKIARARARESRRAAKAAIEVRWQGMMQEWQKAVEMWEKKCEELKKKGVLKKNLPRKPTRPKKPTLVDEMELSSSDEDDDDDDL